MHVKIKDPKEAAMAVDEMGFDRSKVFVQVSQNSVRIESVDNINHLVLRSICEHLEGV